MRRVDIRYSVNGATQAQRAAQDVANAEKKMADSVRSANKELKSQESAWTSLKASIVAAESAVSLMQSALGGIKSSLDGLKSGAQVRDVARAFEQLGGSAASLGVMRDNLRSAVSDNQIRRFANMARVLGLTAKQFEQLTPIANAASNVLGIDVAFALESVTTGVARQSKLWLDNLGILVDVEGEQKKLAKSLGTTTAKLDDAQKKQAFFNGVVAAGAKIIESAPLDGYADSYNRIEAAVSNAADMVNASLSKAFTPLAESLARFVKENQAGLTRALDGMASAFLTIGQFAVTYSAPLIAFAKTFFAVKLYKGAAASLAAFVASMQRLPALTGAASAAGASVGAAFVGSFKTAASGIGVVLSSLIRGLGAAGLVISAAVSLGQAIGDAIGAGAEKTLSEMTAGVVAQVKETYAALGLDAPLTEAVSLERQRRAGLAVPVGKMEGSDVPVLRRVSDLMAGESPAFARQFIQAEVRRLQAAQKTLERERTAALRASARLGGGAEGTERALGRFRGRERQIETALANLSNALARVGTRPTVELSDKEKKDARKALARQGATLAAMVGASLETGRRVSLMAETEGGARDLPTLAQASAAFRDQERRSGARFSLSEDGGGLGFVEGIREYGKAVETLIGPLMKLEDIGTSAFNSLTDGIGRAATSAIIAGESFGKSIKKLTAAILESISVQAFSQAAYLSAIGIALAAGLPIPGVGVFGAASAGAAFAAAGALTGVGAAAALASKAVGGGGGGGGAVGAVARGGGFDTPGRGGAGVDPQGMVRNEVTVLVSIGPQDLYGAMARTDDENTRSRARRSFAR